MGSGEVFFDAVSLTNVVDKENIVLIAPSLGNGYCLNSFVERQADFLIEELLPLARKNLPVSDAREDNLLLGVSMGGFGAVRWALETPQLFGAVAAVSGVFDPRLPVDDRARKNRELRPLLKIFGEGLMSGLFMDVSGNVRPEADINLLLRELASRNLSFPRLGLFCGGQDYLSLSQTSALAETCNRLGFPAETYWSDGSNDTAYWAEALPRAMRWLLRG